MSGLLGTAASSIVDMNLLLQVVIYILLVAGVVSAKRGKFRRHGLLQGAAVLLGSMSLILVMGPSLLRNFSGIITTSFGLGSPLTLLHAIVGALSLVMGWISVLALRPCGKVRVKRGLGPVRRYMLLMFAVWTLSFILGITVYSFFYL